MGLIAHRPLHRRLYEMLGRYLEMSLVLTEGSESGVMARKGMKGTEDKKRTVGT